MITRLWLRLAEKLVPAIIALAIVLAWQADRRDRAQVAAQLAAAQQTIAQAAASQKDRDAQLTQTLAQLTAEKQSNLTTAQLLQAVPQALGLPAPIALQTSSPQNDSGHPQNAATNAQGNSPASASPAAPLTAIIDNPMPHPAASAANAVIPSADLRPLYDFALDCQACQAKLAASQGNLADERTKTAALTKERDAALRAAKGGSAMHRIARATKWFLIGAAAGAVAAKAASH